MFNHQPFRSIKFHQHETGEYHKNKISYWHLHLLLQALQSSKKTHVGGMPGHQAEFGTPYWKFPNIKWGEVIARFLSQILWFNKNTINQMESALLLLSVWKFTTYNLHQNQWNQQLVCVCVCVCNLHGLHLLLQLFFNSLHLYTKSPRCCTTMAHRRRWCQSVSHWWNLWIGKHGHSKGGNMK